MPYPSIILEEAKYATGPGLDALEDRFYGLYSAVLATWFPTSRGCVFEHQASALLKAGVRHKLHFVVVPPAEPHNTLLIVEIKPPNKWNDAGKALVVQELAEHIQSRIDRTKYSIIHGIGCVGLYWAMYEMEKGLFVLQTVLGWRGDITSDQSYDDFRLVADMVYSIQ